MVQAESTIKCEIEHVWDFITSKDNWQKFWPSGLKDVLPKWVKGGTLFWDTGEKSSIFDFVEYKHIGFGSDFMRHDLKLESDFNFTFISIATSPLMGATFNDGGVLVRKKLNETLFNLKHELEGDQK